MISITAVDWRREWFYSSQRFQCLHAWYAIRVVNFHKCYLILTGTEKYFINTKWTTFYNNIRCSTGLSRMQDILNGLRVLQITVQLCNTASSFWTPRMFKSFEELDTSSCFLLFCCYLFSSENRSDYQLHWWRRHMYRFEINPLKYIDQNA